MRQVLREYQADGLDRARAALRELRLKAKRRRLLLVAPTGAGKTTIASHIIEGAIAKGGQILFLAHRKELIDQASERLDQHDIAHGVIKAGHHRWQPLWPVQVASVQTLVRRLADPRHPMRPTLVVVDEAHHARAETYAAILDAYPDAVVIGLTATPWRTDGRGLGELFDDVVVVSTPAELVALWRTDHSQGLVPLTGYAYDSPKLETVKVRKTGDYDDEQLAKVMTQSTIVGNVLEQYAAHALGQRAVGFAVTIEHSRAMVDQFHSAGIAAEHVDGTMSKADREGPLRRLATGETSVIWNVGVLTEGWDCPAVSTCLLARPTKSVGLFIQMVGRIRRPVPGKVICRLHDHAGAVFQHGHPDADRDYSLTFDPKKHRAQLAEDDDGQGPLRRCSACCAIFDATLGACPECGHTNSNPRKLKQLAGVAIPLEEAEQKDAALIPWAVRRSFYEERVAVAKKRGFNKPHGWASWRFKEKFNEWPPRSWATGGR